MSGLLALHSLAITKLYLRSWIKIVNPRTSEDDHMNEYIQRTIIFRGDKPITLGRVKPFDNAQDKIAFGFEV